MNTKRILLLIVSIASVAWCTAPAMAVACCLPDGTCVDIVDETACEALGGSPGGVVCVGCPQPGACCMPDGSCRAETVRGGAQCIADGGTYQGDGTLCDDAACPCTADIAGGDGMVDAVDLLMLMTQWSSPCPDPCEADITGPAHAPDGNVDALDFLMIIAQWGSCSGP